MASNVEIPCCSCPVGYQNKEGRPIRFPSNYHSINKIIKKDAMDNILGPPWHPQVFAYRNDIIIATDIFDKHLWLLRKVLARLKEVGM